MRLRVFLGLMLAMIVGSASAHGQASPYSNSVFKPQIFTASGVTGSVIQLNGLLTPSTVGSSFAVCTVTVTGTSLSTVSFSVLGSSDNGVTFAPMLVYGVTTPSVSSTTTTATANGQYQTICTGMTHIKFMTVGTFTGTSVSLTLTGSPIGVASGPAGPPGATGPAGATGATGGGAISGVQSTPIIQQLTRSSISVDSMKVTGTSRDFCYSFDPSVTIWVNDNPAVSDTLKISGTTITFVASGATGLQVNIGANAAATAVSLNAMLSASSDTNLLLNSYSFLAPNLIVIAPNSGAGSANPLVSWNTPSSITTFRAYNASYDDCWTQRASRFLGLPLGKLFVYAGSGNQQCNELVNQEFVHDPGPGSVNGQLYVGGGPVNDVTYGGGNPAGTVGPTSAPWPYSTGPFRSCLTAKLLWNSIPVTSKVMANSTASHTGTCAPDSARFATGGTAAVTGYTCTASGSSFSLPINVVSSGPVFGWYLSIDSDSGMWTYSLDGGTPVSVATASTVPILMVNSQTTGVFSFTIPSVAAGSHTITFSQTSSGTMPILAIGQPPSGSIYSKPWMVQFDVAPQGSNINAATVAQYNSVINSVVSTVQGYGLNINLAPESLTVQPNPQDGAFVGSFDHENVRVGEREMFDAFASVLSGVPTQPGQSTIYVPTCTGLGGGSTISLGDGTPCVQASGPGTLILPIYNAFTNTSLGSIRSNAREVKIYNVCPFSSCIVTVTPALFTGNGTCPSTIAPVSMITCVNFGGPNWYLTGTNILSGQTGATSGAALASGASQTTTASIAGPLPSALTQHGPQGCVAFPANGGTVAYPFVQNCVITAQNVATVTVTNFGPSTATPPSYIFYVRVLSDY